MKPQLVKIDIEKIEAGYVVSVTHLEENFSGGCRLVPVETYPAPTMKDVHRLLDELIVQTKTRKELISARG